MEEKRRRLEAKQDKIEATWDRLEAKRDKIEAKRDKIEAKLTATSLTRTEKPLRSAEGDSVLPSIELPPVVFEHSPHKGHGR